MGASQQVMLAQKITSGGFVPPAGCKLWLIGDNAPSGSVGTWTDGSGNGNDATQGTGGNKPTKVSSVVNGHDIVRFNGTSTFLLSAAPFGNNASIFVVANTSVPATTQSIIHSQSAGGADSGAGFYSNSLFWYQGGLLNGGSITSGTFNVLEWVSTSTSAGVIYLNASSTATGSRGSDSDTTLAIGSNTPASGEYLNGDIAEILVFDSGLGTTDRQSVEAYLKAKYNTP